MPRVKRNHIIFLVVFLVAAVGVKLWSYRWPTERLVLADESLRVLVADTSLRQYRGLGGRDSLAPYDGMVFLFPESARHGIVMRDMKFSIDVVWFAGGEVVDIASSLPLQPGVKEEELRGYFPRADADMVLELPAGWAAEHDLKIGDRVNPS